jgi:hypothetical protein
MTLFERIALLAPAMTPRDVAAGRARWLQDELVCTEHARERLRAWVLAGGLSRPAPDVRARLQYYGDVEVLPIVVRGFQRMAPPARDYVLEHAAIVGVGWSTYGWTAAAIPATPHVIVLSGARRDDAAIEHTVLHEAAHCWLEATPAGIRPASAEIAASAARAGGKTTGMDPKVARKETRAEALVGLWKREHS